MTFWLLKCQWHYYDNTHARKHAYSHRKKCTKKNEAKMNGCFTLSKHFFQAYRIYPSWILKYKWQLYQTWSAKKVLSVVMSSTHIRWNWIGWVGERADGRMYFEWKAVQIHFIHINLFEKLLLLCFIVRLYSLCLFESMYAAISIVW